MNLYTLCTKLILTAGSTVDKAGSTVDKAGSTVDKAGSRADKAGSRADEGRGDYQERAAADSGDETESGSSVCGVVCHVTRGHPDCRRLSWKNS